ncbi:MAG: response regulator [Myxococcales bacterium]|nr:response regulator [Myxococcales bacterium]
MSTERLDAVLALAEDLAVGVARLRHRIDGISAVEGQLEQVLHARAGQQGQRAGDGALAAELGRVHQRLGASAWDVSTDAERLATAAGTLLEELRAMRMLPASTLFETLARPCRDWARALDKRVEVELRGGDVRLDKRVLEGLKAPLVHLLRNAVAHGLEAPREREAAGKSSIGHLVLAAESRGHRVALVVSDDGRGVDVGAVRERAVREQLVSDTVAADLGDEAVLELIFREGFSTRTEATAAAGRGVGLSVVREAVERLRGQVTVVSTPGVGTTFTLDVPLTVAATRGLVVSAGGELYALPLAGVERVALLPVAEVRQLHGVPSAQIEAVPVRLASLAALLDRRELPLRLGDGGTLQVVVLAAGRHRLAVTVDVILGERPMILKDLPGPLRAIGVLAGATILDDGRIAPVLDLEGLVAEGLAGAPVGDETARRRTTVRRALVVDDSVTTRMLVAGELGALGYRVVTAADGLQALGALEAQPFDVLVTDANMPNMDGFDLTRSVRASPRLAHLPVVLLTSADGAADQLRGVEVGADAYVIKKDFVRENMGSLLDQLLRRSATP